MKILDSILKSRDITLPTKGMYSQSYGFSSSHVGMYSQSYGFSSSHVQMCELDHKEG